MYNSVCVHLHAVLFRKSLMHLIREPKG